MTIDLINTQAIIVACAVLHNICIDMHDELPNDDLLYEDYDNDNANIAEDNLLNMTSVGRQVRDGLIRDHFANLE